jgi:hypothetical protein
MEKSVQMGLNKTGTQMAPILAKSMARYAEESPITQPETPDLEAIRKEYLEDAGAVGTVPLPGTLKGALSVGTQKLTGRAPEILIDKLGERLAFERSGTRLHEALLLKCKASSLDLPIERLQQIRDEEHAHFMMLKETMNELGADPTAQTPCADVTGVASMGLLQVLTDPRTDIPQCLNAVLVAELTDVASWELLIELVENAGMNEVADRFRRARASEEEHLETIRGLLRTLTLNEPERVSVS